MPLEVSRCFNSLLGLLDLWNVAPGGVRIRFSSDIPPLLQAVMPPLNKINNLAKSDTRNRLYFHVMFNFTQVSEDDNKQRVYKRRDHEIKMCPNRKNRRELISKKCCGRINRRFLVELTSINYRRTKSRISSAELLI
jgi:hypothetical protein